MRQPFPVVFVVFASLLLQSAPVSAETGTLEVTSDPSGAKVYINDIFVGRTPYRNEEMPVGTHRVRALLNTDLPAATWEGTVMNSEPAVIDFSFDDGSAPPMPAGGNPLPEETATSPDTGTHSDGAPEDTRADVTWGHLKLRVELKGDSPEVTADECYLAAGVKFKVLQRDLGKGNYFTGKFDDRGRLDQFAYEKQRTTMLHDWDEDCSGLGHPPASLFVDLRPGSYDMKIVRRVKTRNLRFGTIPDDDIIYKTADHEDVSITPGATLILGVTIDPRDGSYTIDRRHATP